MICAVTRSALASISPTVSSRKYSPGRITVTSRDHEPSRVWSHLEMWLQFELHGSSRGLHPLVDPVSGSWSRKSSSLRHFFRRAPLPIVRRRLSQSPPDNLALVPGPAVCGRVRQRQKSKVFPVL